MTIVVIETKAGIPPSLEKAWLIIISLRTVLIKDDGGVLVLVEIAVHRAKKSFRIELILWLCNVNIVLIAIALVNISLALLYKVSFDSWDNQINSSEILSIFLLDVIIWHWKIISIKNR